MLERPNLQDPILQSAPVAAPEEDVIELGAIFGILWRGKWWVMLTTLLAVLGGAYYAFEAATPIYRSTAVIVLEKRQPEVAGLDSVVSGISGDVNTINTEVEVLQSRGLIGKLVTQLDLTEDPEFNPRLVPQRQWSLNALVARTQQLFAGNGFTLPQRSQLSEEALRDLVINRVLRVLEVENISLTYAYEITFESPNRRKAAQLANALAELYILEQLEVKFAATEQATTWLTDRVAELQVSLEQMETRVEAFNADTDLVSPEALDGLNRQLKELRDRIGVTEDAARNAEATVAELAAAREAGDVALMADLAADRTLTRTLALIESGAEGARETFDTRFAQVEDRARLNVDRAEAQTVALRQSVMELEARISKQSADLVELQQLQRETEASRLIYEFFLNRLKETSVQQGIQQSDSRLLSAAVVPNRPAEPDKALVLLVAAVLGFLIGAAFVFVREMLQNTFRTSEDLESYTGYTVMGSIPKVPSAQRTRILEYFLSKPTSQPAEAIRNLRTSILLSNVDNPPQVVMFTSSLPAEGKTTQALLLAQNMAALGRKVLLIEGDIRRRVFAQYFDIKEKRGLVSVLSGDVDFSDVVYREKRLGADVLIGEKPKINAADLYSSDRFSDFLNECRKVYDLIVIDTPPVLVVPDARVIGQHADAILYAVKWDQTAKTQVRSGLGMFESVGIKVTGLVLSQVDPKGLKRYGYGRYGSYGAYGNAYRGYYEN